VFVATPDHHHAPASSWPFNTGSMFYCEKPLCHDVFEGAHSARARASSGDDDDGNQGHCEEGYRLPASISGLGPSGRAGDHSWSGFRERRRWSRPSAKPVPAGFALERVGWGQALTGNTTKDCIRYTGGIIGTLARAALATGLS